MSPMVGPIELILIALACLLGLAITAGVVALAFYMRRQPRNTTSLAGENCRHCGKPTVSGAPFCPHCGRRVAQAPPENLEP